MRVAYIRVSTAEQNTARQELIARELGAERIYTEKISGKDTNRPQLQAMLDFVRDGDMVIVESYSRLARSTKDLLEIVESLNKKGVKFKSHKENIDTGTPQGKLMLTMFAGLAQFERECLLQRQREGIELAKAQGKYTGRPQKKLADLEDVCKAVEQKDISVTKASKLLGVSRSTFYRRYQIYIDDEMIDF